MSASDAGPPKLHDWAGDDGERWAANLPLLHRMLRPFGEAAIAAANPGPGESVLDVGCGAGATSLALARLVVPGGRIVGLDLSPALIAEARSQAAGEANVSFQVGDASTVPLGSQGFDLLFSRFGVMFFTDPVAAFRNLYGALRPGGRLAFICWRAADENEWMMVPAVAVATLLPPLPPPPADAPGPFAFARKERITDVLQQAGFEAITVQPHDLPALMGESADGVDAIDQAAQFAVDMGPVARAIAGQPDVPRQQVLAAVRRALVPYQSDGAVTLRSAAWVVTARR